jgi:hypothetical protein
MNRREWAEMLLAELNGHAWFLDGYDDAIIGVTDSHVVYDEGKIIDILMADGATADEAWDHYGFNILGSIPPDDDDYPSIIKTIDTEAPSLRETRSGGASA